MRKNLYRPKTQLAARTLDSLLTLHVMIVKLNCHNHAGPGNMMRSRALGCADVLNHLGLGVNSITTRILTSCTRSISGW